jgi:hypothetical protein
MSTEVDLLLALLRENESTRWVAEQVVESFRQGLTMSFKEASGDSRFFALQAHDISSVDKRKRDKYETTRPYADEEKLNLLLDALKTLFVEVPDIQDAAFRELEALGLKVAGIEFEPPESIEPERESYTLSREPAGAGARRAENFAAFEKLIRE